MCERERESVCVCVCVCARARACKGGGLRTATRTLKKYAGDGEHTPVDKKNAGARKGEEQA